MTSGLVIHALKKQRWANETFERAENCIYRDKIWFDGLKPILAKNKLVYAVFNIMKGVGMESPLKESNHHVKVAPDDFKDLMKSNERSIAIVGAETIGVYLEFLLSSVMAKDTNLKDLFNSDNSPLSTLSAKIKVAYAFKLIDKKTERDLYFIRKIRNEFAHSVNNKLSFQDSPVREYCNALSTVKVKKNKENYRLTDLFNQAIQENIDRISKKMFK
jgi:hypothetical protein